MTNTFIKASHKEIFLGKIVTLTSTSNQILTFERSCRYLIISSVAFATPSKCRLLLLEKSEIYLFVIVNTE